ncbi:hypothetical protein PAXRUDRAFT_32634 [Paxillus rubicundulus Ve08.2h10]|uniref:Uncharacterized protein n=1 Tax=Paxillus rubicundulus Ve08.2h10 TaxID=930991 RepID=A0A0D0DS35_9AGAM|nr:hypothetical protein PAXRUDRAFT_32634 [Paxillus rubicundulus Ve08.2h10]
MPVLQPPLANAKFNLDASGVAGFFGGEGAIAAMATVHLYHGRKWLGWYNSPGSYTIAKRFGQLANTRFWKGLFPGRSESPAIVFGLDVSSGPKYAASVSGTEMQTGHLGYLTLERSKDEELPVEKVPGRQTAPGTVTLLKLQDIKYDDTIPKQDIGYALFGLIPIITSVATCVMCAWFRDWYCSSMILLGIISSGLISLVIGSGKLSLKSVDNPAPGAPPGDGMLLGDNAVVVLKGAEKDVNAITKGKFLLEIVGHPTYNRIGGCSLLLLVQFFLQLLVIPQGTLFGQVMFIASLGVSWVYNSYLSSLEKEKIQANILFRKLGNPSMLKFELGTRTSLTVFACLLICHGMEISDNGVDPDKIIRKFIANDTIVWQRWRGKVVQQIKIGVSGHLSALELDQDDQNLRPSDVQLLTVLLADAKSAFNGYLEYRIRF